MGRCQSRSGRLAQPTCPSSGRLLVRVDGPGRSHVLPLCLLMHPDLYIAQVSCLWAVQGGCSLSRLLFSLLAEGRRESVSWEK